MVLGYPPFGWPPAAWLAAGVLLWSWLSADTRLGALAAGYAGGVTFFGALFWWLNNVELIAYLPLVIVQAAFFVWIAWVAWRMRSAPPWAWVLAVTGAWALSEIVRDRAPFGGFPWGVIGLTVDATPLRGSAQWIGATGWSVLLVGFAALVIMALQRRVGWWDPGLLAIVIVGVGVAGIAAPAAPDGEAVRIAVVQGNSPCPGSTCPNERQIIFENHLGLTRAAIHPGTVDLVIWPESSTGFSSDPLTNPVTAELISAEARRLGAYLLVGGDRAAGDDAFVNSNLVYGPTGTLIGEYRKTHPVPFGEYVPARPLFDWIPALDQVPRDMVRGPGAVTFDIAGVPLGSVISYEGAFARYPREAVRSGAGLLVVATNEASFGDSPAADQFIGMSRIRASELGIDVVHAAVTGKSAVLHANGQVDGPTGLFTAEVLTATVRVRDSGDTLYARWGDWLQSLVAVVGLGVLVAPRLAVARPWASAAAR